MITTDQTISPFMRTALVRGSLRLLPAFVFALAGSPGANAADVTVQPSAGNGFVVKNASGTSERLRVQESGAVSLPGVASAPAQPQGLCVGAGGLLGPCSGGGGGTGGGASLPAGAVNQTLRYDASNTLVANDMFQVFSDGSLVARGTLNGSLPKVTGPGARMTWDAGKAVFHAGYVDGTQWDTVDIGSVAMGYNTQALKSSAVAMGNSTIASGISSTALGDSSQAAGDYSLAAGTAATSSGRSSIALGESVTAKGFVSTAMGYKTSANGRLSTAIGSFATAQGEYSVAMGSNVYAQGDTSVVMGTNAASGGNGSFVFGDSAAGAIVSSGDNQFVAMASGGVTFYTTRTPVGGIGAGVTLSPGTGSWTALSDRNAKTAVQAVNSREVLEKVVAMPMNTWQYKTQEAKYRHMGPMAQDFYAAFHLGERDTGIDTIDADGVALAAIQGLNSLLIEKDNKTAAKLDEKEREIATLRVALESQEAKAVVQEKILAEQKTRIAALESLAGELAEVKAQIHTLRAAPSTDVAVALLQPK